MSLMTHGVVTICAPLIAVSGAVSGLIACQRGNDELPAELGDCVPTAEAGCRPPVGGVGTGAPHPEGGTPDAGGGAASTTGSCNVTTLGLSPSNPLCSTCLAVPAPNGCCEAVSACEADPNCRARVRCALGQMTPPCPVDPSYSDFFTCLINLCSSQCSDIGGMLNGDF
jgi:hypothetical protein